jgi:hypothetical protein
MFGKILHQIVDHGPFFLIAQICARVFYGSNLASKPIGVAVEASPTTVRPD